MMSTRQGVHTTEEYGGACFQYWRRCVLIASFRYMTSKTSATWFRWNDMPKETLSDTLARRLITGDQMMLAHVYLKKGCVVPKHAHHNEQLTYILEGALQFTLGENQDEQVLVKAGEVLLIPSNLPHMAVAVEDTLDVDVFSPPRQDWIDKTDSYLRR
jgi:quercetin dioxygenase-like cupin family protein